MGRGEAAVLSRTYQGPALRPLVHTWVNDVIEQFTGMRGRVRLAHRLRHDAARQSEIGSVGADGAREQGRSPTWAPSA